MQKIRLLSLSLLNFKGIREFRAEFGDTTNIFGRNASGKTTLFDAFIWLLFGKDSTDRKDFEIKTLDKVSGQPYRKLNHEVEAVLDVDGQTIHLKRIYKEKWTKKRGSATEEFTGHEQEYFWNDVPYNEREYTAKLSALINEQQFKLLTGLHYFNETLKWQDRRAMILQLAGGITDLDLAEELNTDKSYDHLIKALKQNKTIEEYRKEVVSKKNKIKEENRSLPERIEELRRAIPPSIDVAQVQQQIVQEESDLQSVENMLMDKSAVEKKWQEDQSALAEQKGTHTRRLSELKHKSEEKVQADKRIRESKIAEHRSKIRSKEDERSRLLSEYNQVNSNNDRFKARLSAIENEIDGHRKAWANESAKEFSFDPQTCACPTCKQPLQGVDVASKEAELRSNFNLDKSKKIQAIEQLAAEAKASLQRVKDDIAINETELGNIKSKGEVLNAELHELNRQLLILEEDHRRLSNDEEAAAVQNFENDPEVATIRSVILNIEQQMSGSRPTSDNSELLQRKRSIIATIDSLKAQLAKQESITGIKNRIEELMIQEAESANQIAELEGIEFSLLEFDKAKMDLVEKRINNLFQMVTFKLFDTQINGGVNPTCVTLIDGVPYTDANTASKINASLDIIKVFSDHYGVKAPVFIDNRESVTNLIVNDLQIINLFVSAADQQLRVEHAAEAAYA